MKECRWSVIFWLVDTPSYFAYNLKCKADSKIKNFGKNLSFPSGSFDQVSNCSQFDFPVTLSNSNQTLGSYCLTIHKVYQMQHHTGTKYILASSDISKKGTIGFANSYALVAERGLRWPTPDNRKFSRVFWRRGWGLRCINYKFRLLLENLKVRII